MATKAEHEKKVMDEETYAKKQRAEAVYNKDTSSEGLYTAEQLMDMGFTIRNLNATKNVDSNTTYSSDDTEDTTERYGTFVQYDQDGNMVTSSNTKYYKLSRNKVSSWREGGDDGETYINKYYKYTLTPVTSTSGNGSLYSVGNVSQGGNNTNSTRNRVSTSSGYTQQRNTASGEQTSGVLLSRIGSALLGASLLMNGLGLMNGRNEDNY